MAVLMGSRTVRSVHIKSTMVSGGAIGAPGVVPSGVGFHAMLLFCYRKIRNRKMENVSISIQTNRSRMQRMSYDEKKEGATYPWWRKGLPDCCHCKWCSYHAGL